VFEKGEIRMNIGTLIYMNTMGWALIIHGGIIIASFRPLINDIRR